MFIWTRTVPLLLELHHQECMMNIFTALLCIFHLETRIYCVKIHILCLKVRNWTLRNTGVTF